MAIRIPDAHKKAVVRLARLSSDEIAAIDGKIRTISPSISPRSLAQQLAPQLETVIPDLTLLLVVLVSLARTRRVRGITPEELASEVALAAADEKVPALQLSTEELSALRERIALLLSENPTLDVTQRAADVYFAHERLYHSSRILTDIRPVFRSDDSSVPTVGMIVHNLELSVSEEGRETKRYVSMNVHDLRELHAVVNRALEKHMVLQQIIADGRLTYIDDEPTDTQRAR